MAQPKRATFQDDASALEGTDTADFPEEFSRDTQEDTSFEDMELGALHERDNTSFMQMNPPKGIWMKEGEWQVKRSFYEQDSLPGDCDPRGRTFIKVTGRVKTRVVDGVDYDPVIEFSISPDIRYKQDKPDEKDRASLLWIQVFEGLYVALHGAMPKKGIDLINMLQYDDYAVRTMQGDNGPVVLDIMAPNDRRTRQRR